MSNMFNTIKRLYDSKKLTITGVRNAVIKGWITVDEYALITGEIYIVS